ncbi:beta-N-acetylhexosaminidase [Sphingobacterium sp. JB170]|uniref:beta-N-acetylhexosaminidase n=1 Tax=Sphingobacterium sp. JB170 TaxID=1434842 RepID=UPI00097EA5CB|nr:family 20 glycosylhydrolase [Sphingobacterium sp. JB170]SJN18436.1 Beta-hexosaminidase [Sphingobacterium sp. JB170]
MHINKVMILNIIRENSSCKRILLSILLSLLYFHSIGQTSVEKPAIIPAPVKVEYKEGTYQFDKLKVHTKGFNDRPENLIRLTETIFKHPRVSKKGRTGKLFLQIEDNGSLTDEKYKLVIDQSGIHIKARTERAIFYALQTLSQLSIGKEAFMIPFAEVEDYPRYAYRGALLDVGRYFFPVSFVKQYIDLMARYKMNTFHWHLTDDPGWRIEIKRYPKLTSVGAYRNQTLIGHQKEPPLQFDGTRNGGFYTQDEIKEIVAYAAERYITVIPEIEMPGHSLAALAAYPHLACGDDPGPFEVAQRWGVVGDVYCAGKESTFEFLENVLDEVLELFPSSYIHLGGDECPKTKWEACKYCQQRIKDENLKNEHELQSYFIQRMEKYLNAKGRRIIGWDEILEGGLAPNATVMSWRGTKGGIAAAKQGHDVIMTPSSYVYLDHRESKSAEEPLTNGKFTPLEKVYSYDPTPVELSPEEQKHILGVQANLWTEFIATENKAFYMLFPRFLAVAEVGWTPLDTKDWVDFSEERVPIHLAKLDAENIRFRVPEPIGAKDTTLIGNNFDLTYKVPVKGAKIYYTINGFTPSDVDYLYDGPVQIQVPAGEERIVKSVVIAPSGKRSVVTTTVLSNK